MMKDASVQCKMQLPKLQHKEKCGQHAMPWQDAQCHSTKKNAVAQEATLLPMQLFQEKHCCMMQKSVANATALSNTAG